MAVVPLSSSFGLICLSSSDFIGVVYKAIAQWLHLHYCTFNLEMTNYLCSHIKMFNV